MTREQSKNPVHMSGIIGNVVRSLGISRSYHGWLIVNNWEEIVGEYNAKHSPAILFENGVLFVEVIDAGRRANLSMQTEDFMEKIHSFPYGRVVKQLRFVAGRKGN